MVEDFMSRTPHCPDFSLKEKAQDENIDYNKFLHHMAGNKGDQEMAEDLGVSEKTVRHLREHFEKVGVHSVLGQE